MVEFDPKSHRFYPTSKVRNKLGFVTDLKNVLIRMPTECILSNSIDSTLFMKM